MATLRMKIVFWVTLICMSGDAFYVSAAESNNLLMFLPSILSANVANKTCGDNWKIIGDIPEYSFSSEPLINENTVFTMNVDPSDQLMLTAVTTNGWTVEYSAVKDAMGAPVVFTGFHAQRDDTGEYLEMKFDDEGHPVFIEQQGEKKVLLNWNNCTMYGEKEWTVVGELPDFSSIPSPVVNDQAEVLTNTNPSDPLWLTVTTNDGWIIKYFAKKDAEGAVTTLSFVQAEEIAGENVIKTKMDKYGQPVQFSFNDGKIVTYDWTLHEVRAEDGTLQPPIAANELAALAVENSASSSSATCAKGFTFLNISCNALGFIPGAGGVVAGGLCGLATSATGAGVCGSSSSPELDQCLIMASIASTVGGVALGAAFAATGVGATVSVPVSSIVSGLGNIAGQLYCNDKYGHSSGDPHLRTFDGLGYDFQAVGEFVYIQSTEDPTEMTVQIRQASWVYSKHIAGNTAVAMSVGGDIVEINAKKSPHLSVNNAPVTVEDGEIIQLNNGCKIYAETQHNYWIIWKDNSMAEVRTYSGHLDISVSLTDNRKESVKGLLGNYDGDKANDLQNRDGSKTFNISTDLTKDELYNQFGNSWRITQEESLFTYAEGEDTATYTDLNFPYELVRASDLSETVRADAEQTCRDAGITDSVLLEDCILDVGMTGDATFADNMTDLTPPDQTVTVTDDWLLYWDAQKAEGDEIVRITPDATQKAGMALRQGVLNLDADFEKTFTVYLGNSILGGYGMIFLLLPETPPENVSLREGDIMGFSTACNDKPCLGVEIDTNYQAAPPGPSADHIALIKNGSIDHYGPENEGLPVVTLDNIEDDATHSLTINWNKDAQVFSVTLDGSTVIAHEGLDLKTLLGTTTAKYGFVGTAGSSEQYFYPVISF